MDTERVRVLLVDDDEDDYVLTRDWLTEVQATVFDLEWVASYDAAITVIASQQHDIYLFDYRLGAHNGLELLRHAITQGCSAPIILLTGQGDQAIDIEAMKSGAADYLEKSQLSAPLLERSIRYALERKRAEAAKRQQTERERLVVEIAQRIRQSLNLDSILNTTVCEVREFLQVDRVLIYRLEPDWSGVVVVESVSPGWEALLNRNLTDPNFANYVQLYQQGRIQATADIYTAGLTQCYIDFLAQLQVRADLVVPILQAEKLWGLLVCNHCAEPRQWQHLEIDLLKQLATSVAIAIQQSELYQQAQTELTERKQAEQKIRDQAALLDVSSDAIILRSLEDKILFWNKGAERLYGWLPEEALGKDANRLLYDDTWLDQLDEVKIILFQTGQWQGELHQVSKTRKEIIVYSRWTLVKDENKQPKSILVVSTDITEKKQLEAQFLRAQRLESIGTLASGIAHDLNNMLAPILMTAQLLETQLHDERSQRLLPIIVTNAKRGAALVKQVLSFARGMEGTFATLQVRHLISEIRQIAKQTFPKLIEISTDISPKLWAVSGDATQLHQVLMNLVVNARDAMPNGGSLQICADNFFIDENYARMHLEAKVGSYIVIKVADTGMGMPPEIVERIFEPFFTTKELGLGTGLGLSTVMGIVKSHGGFVNVQSELGRGTEFQIYLPAVDTMETIASPEQKPHLGQGELILVVDDEAAIRTTTQASLETYNYKVLTASDGIEAIALYAEHQTQINLVLVDMLMPAMDGITTIRTLQKINPQIKIIATSGLAPKQHLGETIDIKINFLPKPYTAQDLLQTINKVLTTNQPINC